MEIATAPPAVEPQEETPGRGLASVSTASAVTTAAELAPCTCPDACERDHDRD